MTILFRDLLTFSEISALEFQMNIQVSNEHTGCLLDNEKSI